MATTNESALKNLGLAIQDQRKRLGLTQADLSTLAGVGPNYIRQIESGKSTAQITKILDILGALGMQLKLEFGKERILTTTQLSKTKTL